MVLDFYEATFTFTRVTTRIFAHPPYADFVDGLQKTAFPPSPAIQATWLPAFAMTGLSPVSKQYPSLGTPISVYDTDPFKRLAAEVNKFNVLENLDDLSKFHIIIGVSGEPSLKDAAAFWGLEHNMILASGSSERLEFDLEALAHISKEISREEIFTKYTLKKDSKVIRVLCDGEPINFALSEGIANSVIDPIYAEMFLAAISVVKDKGLENGLQELPRKTEEEVLSIFKSYQGR